MRLFWVLFLFFNGTGIFCQTPAYLHYNVRDGLPGNLVYCGLQDQRGLLWFGTDKGLACFDGVRFRTYGIEEGLPDPEVLNMYEDRQGRIWLFCFRKKPCYMLNGQIITEKQDSLLAKLEFITSTIYLSEIGEDAYWFSQLYRQAFFCSGKRVEAHNFGFNVAAFAKNGKDELILGCESIYRFLPDRSVQFVYEIEKEYTCRSVRVNGNRILYSFAHRTVLLEWANNRIRLVSEQPKPVGQLYVDRQKRFWVCSPETGAVLFDNDQRDLTNPVVYLAGKKVLKVFEDSAGTFWFCTANEGVFALHQNPAVLYRRDFGFVSPNIRALARNDAGQLFVGDDVGTIHIVSGDKLTHTIATGAVDGYNQIRQIIPVGKGAFWYGTDEALGRYSNNFSKKTLYESNVSIKDMLLKSDTMWYASATLLAFWSPDISRGNNVSFRFTAIDQDGEGIVWAGQVDGLFSRRDSFQYNWGLKFPELKSRIIKIRKTASGQLWVVTANSGLLLVKVRAGAVTGVEVINTSLKSPINNIQDIFEEPNGTVWMATNKGVYGLYPDRRVVHFNSFDGLADEDVNTILVHQDTLWAGSVSGLTRIILKPYGERADFPTLLSGITFEDNNHKQTMYLLDSLPECREIILPASSNNLQLQLGALEFRSRGEFRYELIRRDRLLPLPWITFDNLFNWIINGFKPPCDTIYSDNNNYGLGAFLPPGNYDFKITAQKTSGQASQLPDRWTILKPPYWYQSIWPQLLAWALILYVLYRINRGRLAYREMQVTASSLQLQALQAQMNPHFIGNAVNAIQQFMHPPNPEKSSEYISIFIGLLRQTMFFSERAFITFEEECSYDEEYLQLTQLRFEDRFNYEITGAETIPPDTPVPTMLIQPLLENATLHGIAPEGPVRLHLDFEITHNWFRFTLSDNGIGIKASQRLKKLANVKRESKGLSLLHKKINSLNSLYDLELSLDVRDLSDFKNRGPGTLVTLRYNLDKIWKVKKELP